jgi:outer membrane receptor protein involved in Fe transport
VNPRGWALILILIFATCAAGQKLRTLRGKVVDGSDLPVSGASVEYQAGSDSQVTATDSSGEFFFAGIPAEGTLVVRRLGFTPVTVAVGSDSPKDQLRIQMTPAPELERIQVTANDNAQIPPTPTGQFKVPIDAINESGSLALDDVLREAPGFTLYRRSGSLFANPTTQGVSLRGVGANGASRAVVLLDGIPLNDPFGGWVYWNQVPRGSVQNVEITNGGASDIYGGGALGGVVNIQSRSVSQSFAALEVSYGNENTPSLSFDAGTLIGNWGISVTAQTLRTSGYILVPADQRGSVDTPAGTGDLDGSIRLSRKIGEDGDFFLRWNSLAESRQNGTPVQTNNTRMPSFALGLDWMQSGIGFFSVRAYASDEVFTQNFSSVAADRNSETLTDAQRSPSQQLGLAAQWQRAFYSKHTVTAGIEAHDVEGRSAETTFNAAGPTADVNAGGRQLTLGYFAQDAFLFAPGWLLTLGGRADNWQNSDGFINRFPLPSGPLAPQSFANRSETAFSPRVSLMHSFKHGVTVSASAYRAFRAPTLNELYRNFRVGNVVTNANPLLTAELLTGGEAGASLQEWNGRLTIRGDFFWSEIDDPVANVTLSTTPTLITRERENLGAIRAVGMEVSAELRLLRNVRLTGGYILTDSTVISFEANPALIGLQVPQVAKNQFNIQLSHAGKNWTAGVQARYIGNQFDDDQNLLPLGRAFIVDGEVSRHLGSHASIFGAVENLLDDRYTVARTPITNVGPPTLVRAGFRIEWPAR